MKTLVGAAEPEEPRRSQPNRWVVTSGNTVPVTTSTTSTVIQVRLDATP